MFNTLLTSMEMVTQKLHSLESNSKHMADLSEQRTTQLKKVLSNRTVQEKLASPKKSYLRSVFFAMTPELKPVYDAVFVPEKINEKSTYGELFLAQQALEKALPTFKRTWDEKIKQWDAAWSKQDYRNQSYQSIVDKYPMNVSFNYFQPTKINPRDLAITSRLRYVPTPNRYDHTDETNEFCNPWDIKIARKNLIQFVNEQIEVLQKMKVEKNAELASPKCEKSLDMKVL